MFTQTEDPLRSPILLPMAALLVAARRWGGRGKTAAATTNVNKSQTSAPGSSAGGKSDAEYLNRLDDDLDDLS